eukprot:Nitzschia sp. Nitz4//scaffold145_size56662//27448//29252//NITZ4_006558-RA/size56662-processed-gene-0.28-mRNA-1//-1//CDS//3329536580//6770//frame0
MDSAMIRVVPVPGSNDNRFFVEDGTYNSLESNNNNNDTPVMSRLDCCVDTSVPPAPVTPPSGLPPKSPASISGRFLLSRSSSTRSCSSSRRSRRRGSKKIHKSSSSRSCSSLIICTPEEGESSGDFRDSGKGTRHSLVDPCPNHLNVGEDADDLCSTADLNHVSLPSPSSVLDTHKVFTAVDGDKPHKRQHHRRAKSWDASDATSPAETSSSKTCLQVPSIFRRQKVMCADVASVGNAYDTLVETTGERMTGKEVHEKAKEILNMGHYAQALLMFQALQQAQLDRFGEWHSSVGAATHNVGVVQLRMGQAKEAEEVLERAVAIRRKVLGNDHLDLALSLAKLGSARVVLQKFDEGLKVLREALRITRKTLGRSHKTVAQILCHIACLYFEAGELYASEATFEDALDMYREVFPTETDRDACMVQMTEILCNIGSVHNRRKNYAGAIECFREAVDLQRGVLGHDHPRVIAALDNLGYSFSKNKSYNQALTCYNEMSAAQVSHYGSFTIDCCHTLRKQLVMYEKMKNLDGATQCTRKALGLVQNVPPGSEDGVSREIERILDDLSSRRRRRSKLGCF